MNELLGPGIPCVCVYLSFLDRDCFIQLFLVYIITAYDRYTFPASIYLFKINNGNNRKRCEICSKLTIKKPERCHWRRSGVFIVNNENISHLFLVFRLFTLQFVYWFIFLHKNTITDWEQKVSTVFFFQKIRQLLTWNMCQQNQRNELIFNVVLSQFVPNIFSVPPEKK